VFSVNHM